MKSVFISHKHKVLGFVHLKSSSVSQSSSQSSNPCVQRKSSHASDRKGSRRRMDTEERKDKGTLLHHLKADARDPCLVSTGKRTLLKSWSNLMLHVSLLQRNWCKLKLMFSVILKTIFHWLKRDSGSAFGFLYLCFLFLTSNLTSGWWLSFFIWIFYRLEPWTYSPG